MPGNGAKKQNKTKKTPKQNKAGANFDKLTPFFVLHMWVISIPLQEALAHPIVGHIL